MAAICRLCLCVGCLVLGVCSSLWGLGYGARAWVCLGTPSLLTPLSCGSRGVRGSLCGKWTTRPLFLPSSRLTLPPLLSAAPLPGAVSGSARHCLGLVAAQAGSVRHTPAGRGLRLGRCACVTRSPWWCGVSPHRSRSPHPSLAPSEPSSLLEVSSPSSLRQACVCVRALLPVFAELPRRPLLWPFCC